MATGTELNNVGACGQNLVGYSFAKGCPYNFQNTIEIWRTPADFEFDDSQNFDVAYLQSLQIAGKLSIIKGITDFPEGGTDPLVESLPDNTEISAGDAKYKYLPVFTQDLWYNRLLGFLEGQGNNRFIFIDSAGNMLMTEGSQPGKTRGFLASRTHRGKLILQSPGVGMKQSLEFQLANTYELEDNFVMRFQSSLGFDPRLVEGVVQTHLEFNAVPADTDTTITVKALVDRGRSTNIAGLTDTANWEVTNDGTIVTVSNVALANDVYTLTIPAVATDNVITVRLNGVVNVVGDALYRSNTIQETTTA